MLELKSLISPVPPSSILMALVFGVGLLFMAKHVLTKRDKSRYAMATIRRQLILHHSRNIIVLHERLCDLKTLTNIVSEIDAIPLCAKKRVSVAILADIFIAGSLSHAAFLHFIKIQSCEMILKNIDDKEAMLLKILEGTDKKILSNNLIVQGFDLMDDGRFIDDKRLRTETLARGNRWVKYGHHLNKRQLQADTPKK